MNTKTRTYNYMESFDADEMHEQSKKWLSELSFIKDEQQFLNNLIQSFAIKINDQKEFGQINDFKNAIAENKRQLNPIFKQVQKHLNQLEIMIDDLNQLDMEQAYRKTHKKLFLKMNKYLLSYRMIKERGFVKLSSILKSNKQRLTLGNPEYKISTVSKKS